MKKLLIVVDMINGFITEGNLHDLNIAKIIPNCEKLIQQFLKNGDDVIAMRDCHTEDSQEFLAYPPHCLVGSNESELVDELKKYQDEMTIVLKNSTNGFFAPGFEEIKQDLNNYNEILLVGCCSDICVLQLALSLKTYCNQHNYDCKIKVDSKACATFNIPGHNNEEYDKIAYNLMRSNGIIVL